MEIRIKIKYTLIMEKVDTKKAGPNHRHHDDCPDNLSCFFEASTAPSFGRWDLPPPPPPGPKAERPLPENMRPFCPPHCRVCSNRK